MPLRLTITSFQRLSPGQETAKTLDRGSISIGRAAQNEWILQDPERILSGRHCTIHYQDGGYFLTDTSTNGVYLNDSEQRIGRNQVVRLNEGDNFVLGEYEIAVTLSSENSVEAAEMQATEGPITEAVPIEDLLPTPGRVEPSRIGSGGMADSVIKPSFRDLLAEDHDSFEPRPPAEKPGKVAVATEPPSDLMEPDRAFFEPPSLIPETPPLLPETPALAIPVPEPVAPPEPEQAAIAAPLATHTEPETPAPPILDFPEPPAEAAPTSAAGALIPEDWWSVPTPTAQPAPSTLNPPQNPPPLLEPLQPASGSPASPAHSEPNSAMVAQQTGSDSNALIQSLLQGAGLPPLQLTEAQWLEVMGNLGAIFRETVQGLMEILLARGDVKGEFRLHRTTIGPIENNPLKTSPGQPPLSPEQVMALLLIRQKDAYMSPVQAVCESFNDIKAHQLAVMAGIQAALSRLLARFDPGNLETRLEQSVFDNIWPANRKAKYWDLFTTEYQAIAREAEDDFNELFGDEFARAYEERLRDH